MLPFLIGGNEERPHQTLYWRIDGMWAIRHGDLKLVHGEASSDPPELFDLAADLGEQHSLALTQADQARELKSLWDQWNAEMAAPSPPKDKAARKEAKKQPGRKEGKKQRLGV